MSAAPYITHLSFSRLCQLAHSPLALKQYLEGDRTVTAAMTAGTLLDCLLFTPEELERKFYVTPKIDRRTKEGKAAWEAAQEASNGRDVITEEQMAEARFLDLCIRQNSTVAFHGLLNPDFFDFQVPVEFNYGGFLHRGIKDADGTRRDGEKVIWDLKRMGSRSGEQLVRSQIRNNLYDLQAAIYCHPYDIKDKPVKYYVIAVDNDGFVTPFEVTRDARNKARILWNKLIKAANRCNFEGLDMGCEFWAEVDGFFYY
ncbi:MAG: hypothetical protein KDC70_00060 [Saprospiraceae bacterium]|nr:hypothetical protein [Saprospiraceae bacterium]